MEIFQEKINFQSEININKLLSWKLIVTELIFMFLQKVKGNSDNLVLSADNVDIIFVSLNEV